MSTALKVLSAAFLVAPFLFAEAASADAILYNRCSNEGSECPNGLPAGASPWTTGPLSPGICRKMTCSSPSPDGGGTVKYDCLLCISTGAGGTGGAGGSSAGSSGAETGGGNARGGTASGGGAGTPGVPPSDGCSCAVIGAPQPWTLASAMLLLGLLALRGSRRKLQ